ncbi:LysR family transcriptional regulator [Klebsiella quasipneumoniae]|nr:LysR family transcriptional regulator [Klebsiella quasipneumoniae]RRF81664.1 LysR family transcriptional regulator [Klebsiella quasipneumoniae]
MLLCRVAAAPYPAYGPSNQSLIYPLARLKLPVLAGARGYRGRRRLAAPCALQAP